MFRLDRDERAYLFGSAATFSPRRAGLGLLPMGNLTTLIYMCGRPHSLTICAPQDQYGLSHF
jgi:hypothetical protein